MKWIIERRIGLQGELGRVQVAVALLLCLFGLSGCSDTTGMIGFSQSDPRVKSERATLIGHWQGSATSLDPFFAPAWPDGDHYFLLVNDELWWYQAWAPAATLSLDPTSSPKKLDWIAEASWGRTYAGKGIYRIQDGKLEIAVVVGDGRYPRDIQRPTGFIASSTRTMRVRDLRKAKDVSVKHYGKMLQDKDFQWRGPFPYNAYILPRAVPAARALAFIGDSAVPTLLSALDHNSGDADSIWYALHAIGFPVDEGEYTAAVFARRTEVLRRWWSENRDETAASRSVRRRSGGLPPVLKVEGLGIGPEKGELRENGVGIQRPLTTDMQEKSRKRGHH
jgi:uncharacterized protein (TIGR03067 family)